MNRLITPLVALSLLTAQAQASNEIRITHNGSQPSIKGAAETSPGRYGSMACSKVIFRRVSAAAR